MKIKFELGDFYDILEQYESLFSNVKNEWVENDIGSKLSVSGYRVVISKLKVAFRTGDLYFRNEEIKDKKDERAWDFAHSVDVIYKKDEKNPSKLLAYSTVSIQDLLEDACIKNKYPIQDMDSLNCYIDTEEFIDEDTVRRLYPRNFKEIAKAQYPELFEVIKNKKYRVSKELNGIEVQVYTDDSIYIDMSLRPGYVWYQHWGKYTIIAKGEDEFPGVYQKIVELTKNIVEGNIAIIYVFFLDDTSRDQTLLVQADEVRCLKSKKEVIKYVKNKGADVTADGVFARVCIRICFWDEGSITFRIMPDDLT